MTSVAQCFPDTNADMFRLREKVFNSMASPELVGISPVRDIGSPEERLPSDVDMYYA